MVGLGVAMAAMPHPNGDAEASWDGPGRGSPFERANQLAGGNRLGEAEAEYRKADEQGHGGAAAYAGLFDEARGDIRRAESAYRRADERGDGFGAFRLGLLLAHRGDWDGASAAWHRADDRGTTEPPFDYEALLRGSPAGDALRLLDLRRGDDRRLPPDHLQGRRGEAPLGVTRGLRGAG